MSRGIKLSDAQANVLAVISRVGLIDRVSLSMERGSAASPVDLERLAAAGLVKVQTAERRSGAKAQLYTVTEAGRAALAHHSAGSVYPTRAAGRVPFSTSVYDGAELRPFTARPGAMDAHGLPSRFGRFRHHKDGRVEEVEGGAAC